MLTFASISFFNDATLVRLIFLFAVTNEDDEDEDSDPDDDDAADGEFLKAVSNDCLSVFLCV